MTFFQKFFTKSYRFFAIFILTLVLGGAFTFFFNMSLFATSKSWSAPVILTKSSPRIATMTADVLRAENQADTLRGQVTGYKADIVLMKAQKDTLTDLIGRYDQSLEVQKKVDADMRGRLARLTSDKRVVDERSAKVVADNKKLEAAINKELKAGLITAEAAARARAQIVTAEASLNNGYISTATLDYQVTELAGGVNTLSGGASSTRALESLTRVSALRNELAQLELKLSQAQRDLAVKQSELDKLTAFLDTLTKSPYYVAATSKLDAHPFAFVPYANADAAEVGAAVYSCYFEIIFCSKVGTVKALTNDEEKARHPVSQKDMRGFLIDLELTDPEAAKERVFFIGSKPLFI